MHVFTVLQPSKVHFLHITGAAGHRWGEGLGPGRAAPPWTNPTPGQGASNTATPQHTCQRPKLTHGWWKRKKTSSKRRLTCIFIKITNYPRPWGVKHQIQRLAVRVCWGRIALTEAASTTQLGWRQSYVPTESARMVATYIGLRVYTFITLRLFQQQMPQR